MNWAEVCRNRQLAELPSEKPGKRELYFRAGALEFWICDESGNISFYDSTGQLTQSRICAGFPDRIELPRQK